MTIHHDCEGKGCYKDKLPDWGFLDGCFPRKIAPTDVDGLVHLSEGNRFLFLEWKDRDWTESRKRPSPDGKDRWAAQREVLASLAKLSSVTVLVIRETDRQYSPYDIIWYPDANNWVPANEWDIQQFCRNWSDGADGAKCWPERRPPI